MRYIRPLALVLLLLPLTAAAQKALERKAVNVARTLPASKLDAKLPAVPLERFLQAQAGPGGHISWEANDCGEQTGTIADRGRDFPLCAEATVTLADGRMIVVSVQVGSFKQGIAGTPEPRDIVAGPDLGSVQSLKALRELPAWIKRTEPHKGGSTIPAGTEARKEP